MTHRFLAPNTCEECGQFWPCQTILAQAIRLAEHTKPDPVGQLASHVEALHMELEHVLPCPICVHTFDDLRARIKEE